MRSQNTVLIATLLLSLASTQAMAQSKQYQRPAAKPAATTDKLTPAKAGDKKSDAKTGEAKAEDKSDKLDISDLEQKYWAPKDTDFSVVQNRTYTKAKRWSFSPMYGALINDTFNEGPSFSGKLNYYFDERSGVELSYTTTDSSDSDTTKKFKNQLTGGAVQPDFNRDVSLISVGYNFVPFYAKMSFMGSKILYFDMQITPWIGAATYSQVAAAATGKNDNEETVFSYGIDITQYFFIHKNFALRFDFHNRFYEQDVLAFSSGTVARSESANTTLFLFGFTYFH